MELNQSTSGQPPVNSVPVKEQETVVNPDAVLAKNRELLNEKRVLAEKNAEFENKLKEFEDQKNIAEGKKDEVINSLRERLSETSEKLTQKEQSYNWNTVSAQIKQAAVLKGCKSPDKLMKLLTKNDLDAIEVYDDYSINNEDLNRVLDTAIKDNQDIGLFGVAGKVDDVIPSNAKPAKKSLDKMSRDDIINELLK